MKIEMLNGYVVDIKVKKIDQKRFNKKETILMLNRLSICLGMAGEHCENIKDTYFERISKGMEIAIDKALIDTGFLSDRREVEKC